MSLNQFKKRLEVLNKKINKYYEGKDRKLIRDGIVNIEEYFNSKIKILWILKEPYCDKANGGGGWSITDNLNSERSENMKNDSQSTWHPIAYSSFGILNGFKKFEEMGKIPVAKEINSSLKKIAFINFQKLPAKTSSVNKEIGDAFTRDKEILIEQINVINPDVIICGAGDNAYGRFLKHFNLVDDSLNKCLIQVYHPSQTKMNRGKYVNEIIEKVKVWNELKK